MTFYCTRIDSSIDFKGSALAGRDSRLVLDAISLSSGLFPPFFLQNNQTRRIRRREKPVVSYIAALPTHAKS